MCEYCRDLTASPREYQHGTYGSISLVKFGIKTLLIAEMNKCPKYVKCTSKEVPIKQAYEINYCPNCGEKMDKAIKINHYVNFKNCEIKMDKDLVQEQTDE